MIGICIEASHQRGMGHLFRAMNFIAYLEKQNERYVLFCNENETADRILKEAGISYETVDLWDYESNWEESLIKKYDITIWLNDRLDTCMATMEHVKSAGILLFTIDDMGEGAKLADGNFASLVFEDIDAIPGKNVFTGPAYLILNSEIAIYKRTRSELKNILITLGGSDTYGVTPIVLRMLKKWLSENKIDAHVTVLLGPGAKCYEETQKEIEGTDIQIVQGVPSLMAFFAKFDLAITGGGVTAMEAAASGLPTVVVANELHEIPIGKYLEKCGCSIFAGYYKDLCDGSRDGSHCHRKMMTIGTVPTVTDMSERGMQSITLDGAAHVYKEMKKYETRR